ncbi:RdgB/HAM1 family non-canonical purine NTP pyrophosphatase [uncultured Anaerococcus sp.]|uniref:RdgB/HAM1 family non-canonical purine NTP pyrophosphatase n=1 Tax=uncultured Anaerococcus sp. TaxID=293428 RepID=UPI00280487F6|nr:RdgB/HAM1 family non-canonical purine NTP pyrophosphatase [uncultured Anaerococcus sp.]
MELLFATGNKDKLKEVKEMLSNDSIKVPIDIGISNFDVVEDGNTLEENSYKKASALYQLTGRAVFADDTGLFVKALDNRPGVHSHRYASANATYEDNRKKLLDELSNKDDRSAYFETVISYINLKGEVFRFTGRLDGYISEIEKGSGEFGYDKIFIPENSQKSLAEMTIEEKNQISHRARAMAKFKKLLGEI